MSATKYKIGDYVYYQGWKDFPNLTEKDKALMVVIKIIINKNAPPEDPTYECEWKDPETQLPKQGWFKANKLELAEPPVE